MAVIRRIYSFYNAKFIILFQKNIQHFVAKLLTHGMGLATAKQLTAHEAVLHSTAEIASDFLCQKSLNNAKKPLHIIVLLKK